MKRNSSLGVKVLLFYVIFSLATDTALVNLVARNQNDVYDLAIYNVLSLFTVLEFTFFAFFLFLAIDSRLFRRIIIISGIAFYIFVITLYLYQIRRVDTSFDSLAASIEAILIVMYCTFYLFDQMNKPQVFFIYQEPNFYFVAGFIIYSSGNLFLFIEASNLPKEIRDNFWKINYFLNITKNILFAIAFCTKKSKSLQYSPENPYDAYS